MTDKQQSAYFFAIVFLFACGAALLIYRGYSEYYQQKTSVDLENASIANMPVNNHNK